MTDLDIKLDGDTLVLKGVRSPDTVDEDASFHRRERATGEFRRCVALSEAVDHKRVEATYRNGVLTVTLTKRERISPRKIQIISD
jgi:HSP20 family protein